MKTKNMRKKALMSSVAMLLVAIVALSGATYAWFTANTDAKVIPIYLKTERQSSLVLAEDTLANADTATFTSALNVNWKQTLTPVSGTVGESGALSFKMAVANEDAMTGDEGTTPVSGVQNGPSTAYLQKTILVKSSVKSQVILKSITGAGDLANALRVAVKVGTSTVVYAPGNDDGSVVHTQENPATFIKALAAGNPSGITGVTYSDLYNATATAGGISFADVTIGTLGTTRVGTNLTANTAAEMQITIWLEGNDKDCTNDMSGVTIGTLSQDGNTVLTGLSLTFTSVEVA